MSIDLENLLSTPLPTNEAADFFLRLKGGTKTASADELAEVFVAMPEEEQVEATKEATAFLEKVLPGTEGYHSARMLTALLQLPGTVFHSEFSEKTAEPATDLPATAQGKNMQPTAPIQLPPTAQGQQKAASKDEKSPKEVGKERAQASISAEFEKDKAHRHEANEEFAGRAAGGVLGGLALHRYGKGNPGGTLGGVALGQHLGGKLGKFMGAKRDAHEHEKKADADLPPGASASGQLPNALTRNGPLPPELHAGQAPPPSTGAPDMSEYLANERAGQAAEEEAGAAFYQQKFQEAMQQLQEQQQQLEQAQQQTEQLQQQVSGSDGQIQAAMQQAQMAQQQAMQNVQQAHTMAMDATSQAMESQSEVLRQKQLAAAMRIGAQQMKDGVMSALAQDPTDALAQQLTAPPPGSGGMVGGAPGAMQQPGAVDPTTGQPMAGDPAMAAASQQAGQGGAPVEGPAAGSADPASQPAAAPPEGGGGQEKSKSDAKSEGSESGTKGTTKVEVKQAAAFGEAAKLLAGQLSPVGAGVGALAGGALGAGMAAHAPAANEKLRGHIAELEANPHQRGFARAMDIAQAKARLAMGEVAANHPIATTGLGAAMGAFTGATSGHELADAGSEIRENFSNALQNLRG